MEFPLTITYNTEDKKVGCALMQSALGATFPGGAVVRYFDTCRWELNPSKLEVYTLRTEEDLRKLIIITNGNKS
jgi:hypothetical protein